MEDKHLEILTRFKLSRTSAKIYLTLLELKKAGADTIAKKISNYKPNVYEALDKLVNKGLATYVFEGKKKSYMPINPEKLISTLEESKQKEIEKYEELKKDLQTILPEILSKYKNEKEKDSFEIYRNKEGYRALILEILRENPKFWKGFGNLQVQKFFPYDFKRWFKNIEIRLFSTKSKEMNERIKEAKKTTKVAIKWLPEELQMPVVWTIFGNNLLILIYEPDIIALRIKSEQVVKTFSSQFEYLWKKYSKTFNSN